MKKVIFSVVVIIAVAVLLLLIDDEKLITEPELSSKSIDQHTEPAQTRDLPVSPPAAYELPPQPHVAQTFNNCGPATLSMLMSYQGVNIPQDVIADALRPYRYPPGDNDDKSVTFPEFGAYSDRYGIYSLHLPNGNIEVLKYFISQDIPVAVRTLLAADDDIGHFRIVRGYNDHERMITQDDSYEGANLQFSYDEFNALWQPFNYEYFVLIPEDLRQLVDSIYGDDRHKKAWNDALERARADEGQYGLSAIFNQAVAHYYLGNHKEATRAFERVEPQLSKRVLWYQIEPIEAYLELADYNRVFQLTNRVLSADNRAFSELYYLRGKAYQIQGNIEAARAEYSLAVHYNEHYEPAKIALQKLPPL